MWSACTSNPPESAVVLCVDEKSQVQALARSQPVLPMMPGMPERRTHDYVRHGVTSLFAAFNIADGTVISAVHRRHRASEFKKFLAKIDAEVPADLHVHLVADNYGTHKTPTITAWLTSHPRFHMHFTPTSSSWLNQVERWFAYLTNQLIRRGNHTSVQALEPDLRTWAKTWNENPKPFVWTKTAEQILESLQRLITRINGAVHSSIVGYIEVVGARCVLPDGRGAARRRELPGRRGQQGRPGGSQWCRRRRPCCGSYRVT